MNAAQAIDNIVKMLGLQFKKETFKSTFLVDGTTEVICDNEPLEYKVVSQRAIKKGVDTKEINAIMDAMLNRRETNAKTSSAGLVVHD